MQIAPIPTLSKEINDIRLRTADIVGNQIIPNEGVIYSGGEKSAKLRKDIRKEVKIRVLSCNLITNLCQYGCVIDRIHC